MDLKKKKILLPLIGGVLSIVLVGSYLVIKSQEEQGYKANPLPCSQQEKVVYDYNRLGMLRYSTTGMLNVNYNQFDLNNPKEHSLNYDETSVIIEVDKTEDNHGIKSVKITTPKADYGEPSYYMDLVEGDYNELGNQEQLEKYIYSNSDLTITRDMFAKDGLFFPIDANFILIQEFQETLSQSLNQKTGASIDLSRYFIDFKTDGGVTINGPTVESVVSEKENIYSISPLTGTVGDIFYEYNNTKGEKYTVQFSLKETPYYDLENKKLIINWVIGEPVKVL
jgi:hypothetical protein